METQARKDWEAKAGQHKSWNWEPGYVTYAISEQSNQAKFTLSFLVPITKSRECVIEGYQRETKREGQSQSTLLESQSHLRTPDVVCACTKLLRSYQRNMRSTENIPQAYKRMLPQRSEMLLNTKA